MPQGLLPPELPASLRSVSSLVTYTNGLVALLDCAPHNPMASAGLAMAIPSTTVALTKVFHYSSQIVLDPWAL